MVFAPFEFTPLVYVCLGCAAAMVLLRYYLPHSNRWLPVLMASFIVAIVGDYFLGIRTTDLGFILGIAGYLLAHIGFLTYAWRNITGRQFYSWRVLAVILAVFLIFYFVVLVPGLVNRIPLAIAVLVYLVTSCLTLSASIAVPAQRPAWSRVYAFGVFCLLLSDSLIGLHNFADQHTLYQLYMWPLFYSAMVFIALGVVLQHLYRPQIWSDDDTAAAALSNQDSYSGVASR